MQAERVDFNAPSSSWVKPLHLDTNANGSSFTPVGPDAATLADNRRVLMPFASARLPHSIRCKCLA
jgi:hypothetical protein